MFHFNFEIVTLILRYWIRITLTLTGILMKFKNVFLSTVNIFKYDFLNNLCIKTLLGHCNF